MTTGTTSGEYPDSPQGERLPSNVDSFGAASLGSMASPAEAAPTIPIEPTVGAAFSHAWEVLKRDFGRLLLISFVAWLISAVLNVVLNAIFKEWSSLISLVIATPLYYGALGATLKAVRGQRPELSNIFVQYHTNWVRCVLTSLLLWVILCVGYILLVIPGVILTVRLSFAPLLVIDEHRGPFEAISESWRRTEGHFWTIFLSFLLSFVVIMVGLVLLLVGVIPATMLVYLAFASLYVAVSQQKMGRVAGYAQPAVSY